MEKAPQVSLSLPQRYLVMLTEILHEHIPEAEVWAYGSRVTGGSHDASDIDLVARFEGTDHHRMEDLREALVESDLPITVDILDWDRIPASFHQEIQGAYVVVQSPHVTPGDRCIPEKSS